MTGIGLPAFSATGWLALMPVHQHALPKIGYRPSCGACVPSWANQSAIWFDSTELRVVATIRDCMVVQETILDRHVGADAEE